MKTIFTLIATIIVSFSFSQESLNILKTAQFKWEKNGGILPYTNETNKAFSYNALCINGDKAVFATDLEYELRVISISQNEILQKVKLPDYPLDVVFDAKNQIYYVLSIYNVFVFDSKFNLTKNLKFNTLEGRTKLFLKEDNLLVVGAEDCVWVASKGNSVQNMKFTGQPIGNIFIKPILTGRNSFTLENYNEIGQLSSTENYNFNINQEIATINPVGIVNGNVLMKIEVFTQQVPVKVETKLAEVNNGQILNLIDVPNVYYTDATNDFSQNGNGIQHLISSPDGVYVYNLKYAKTTFNGYPFKLMNNPYHYNDYLMNEIREEN
jgi:hypothetical protein